VKKDKEEGSGRKINMLGRRTGIEEGERIKVIL
jgi:hypothetical protein